MFKLKMLQTWGEYKTGEIIELDGKFAQLLIDQKYAEKYEDNPEPVVKSVGDTATLTASDVETIVKRAVADAIPKADKAAARPIVDIKTHDRILDDPCRGYKDNPRGAGEFLAEVRMASLGVRQTERIKACGNQMFTKAVGADEYNVPDDTLGGYFVAPQFSTQLLTKGIEDEFIVANGAPVYPVQGDILYINAETDTTRTGALFGGMQAYWQKEVATMTASRGKYEQIEIKPKMLTALTYATDNLLQNVTAMGQIISQQFSRVMVYKRTAAFINGVGEGEPLGIMNSPALITVSAEPGQAAATINSANIWKMWSQMRGVEYGKAVWIASNSCKPQIMQLSLAVGTGGAPLMTFNIANPAQMMLLGRPLIFTEHCQALGTTGDIILASFPEYFIGETTYQRSDSSIHVRFESNETTFRFVQKVDGQPWWRTTLTLKEGLTVSPFICLATRS